MHDVIVFYKEITGFVNKSTTAEVIYLKCSKASHTNFQKILLPNWWNTTSMSGQLGEQKIIARLPNWKGCNQGFNGQAVGNTQEEELYWGQHWFLFL